MTTVLLVVYGVFWAASTATFARLRVFSFNEIAVPGLRVQAWSRVVVGFLLGNAGPVALLVVLIRWLPSAEGVWGVAEGAFAGITVVVFPRLLHAFMASDELGPSFHAEDDFDVLLKKWDPAWAKRRKTDGRPPDARNKFLTHLLTAFLVFALALGSALVIGLLAT